MQRHRLRCATALLSQKGERKLRPGEDIKQEAPGAESALMAMVDIPPGVHLPFFHRGRSAISSSLGWSSGVDRPEEQR